MENTLFSSEFLAFLRELQNRNVRYLVVGLAAAVLQGAGLVTQDIDLWFENLSDPEFREAVKAVGGTYIPPIPLPPMLAGKALDPIDIVTHMSGLGKFNEEYSNVRWITLEDVKIPVLSLERIIASKRAANRDKDKLVLPILEDVARTLNAIEDERKND